MLIVGNTDTGKSTFGAYIINEALKIGLRPAIIDADIGQGDLAPPNTIGGAVINTWLLTCETLPHLQLSLWAVSHQQVLKNLSSKQ